METQGNQEREEQSMQNEGQITINDININSNREKQFHNEKDNQEDNNDMQIRNNNNILESSEISSLKDKINELSLQNTQLEDKITKIKLTIPQLKTKFELEINRKEMKFNSVQSSLNLKIKELTSKINEYEKIIDKLRLLLSTQRKEKTEHENIILQQEEKITSLTEQINRYIEIIHKKNRQMKQNELYSVKLVNIVNELWNKFSSFTNKSSPIQTQERLDLNRKIFDLNTQLNANINKVEYLEHKNQILQNALNKSINKKNIPNYKVNKTITQLSRDYSHKFQKRKVLTLENSEKSYKDELMNEFDSVVKMRRFLRNERGNNLNKNSYSYGISDEYLISENVLPKTNTEGIYNEKRVNKKEDVYVNEDNDDVQEINEIMEGILKK